MLKRTRLCWICLAEQSRLTHGGAYTLPNVHEVASPTRLPPSDAVVFTQRDLHLAFGVLRKKVSSKPNVRRLADAQRGYVLLYQKNFRKCFCINATERRRVVQASMQVSDKAV
jgi:hypothetical protein